MVKAYKISIGKDLLSPLNKSFALFHLKDTLGNSCGNLLPSCTSSGHQLVPWHSYNIQLK